MSTCRYWKSCETWFTKARVARHAATIAVALGLLACVQVWTPAVRAPGAGATRGPALVDVPSTHVSTSAQRSDSALKVHLRNRELWILTTWHEDTTARELRGIGDLYSVTRQRVRFDTVHVPFDSIALLEAYGASSRASFGLGLLAVWSGVATAVTIECVANPKSCFGSCPTFYAANDSSTVQAEGFSGSPLRVLEERDVDHLYRLDPDAGPFVLQMRNEALETHAVRGVRLHVVDRPTDGRVYHAVSDSGEVTFHPATNITAPDRCRAGTAPCLGAVMSMDSIEWSSRTDSTDLAARESMVLTYDAARLAPDPTTPSSLGLIIGGRNSLVSTFVFYQSLAYAGSRAGDMMATLERSARDSLPPMFATLRAMATIQIAVARPGEPWRHVGVYREAGPIATDVRIVPFTLPPGRGPIRVRLSLTRGFWRLNQVTLATVGVSQTPMVLEPAAVDRVDPLAASTRRATPPHANASAVLHDLLQPEQYLITYPGDRYAWRFDMPARQAGRARDVFLESTGYYYEWMRREWLPEENAVKAAQVLYAPRAALRALAPLYKLREATMDSVFWRSRVGRTPP